MSDDPEGNREGGVRIAGGATVQGDLVGRDKVVNIYPYFQARPTDLQHTFDSLIADRTREFVGRQFVFDELDEFLRRNSSSYFIIRGEPGIGKSALMAYLVNTRGYIHHFNIASQAINKPQQFLSSVCAQLIARFGLDPAAIPDKAYEDGAFLNQLLAAAASKLKPGEQLVIVIDALDEVNLTGLAARENLLYLPPSLPEGVFVVATARIKHEMHLQATQLHTLDLLADSDGNLQDIGMYICNHLSDEQMQQRLRAWGVTPEQFLQAMVKKSEGNFMYLHYVLPAIKVGRFKQGRLDELPEGLLAYYHCHWAQMRHQAPVTFDDVHKKVVCVLAAAKEAVSIEKVAAFTDLTTGQVLEVVREWLEFLHEERGQSEPRYRVYHASFQEFLKAEVDPGLRTYNAMIARSYLKTIRP